MAGKSKSWPEIAVDACLLGAEAWTVVALRLFRFAQGGPDACSEARLMVTEKIDSSVRLGTALVSGELGKSPKAITDGTISHYRKGVRANRKRLSRG